MWNDFKIWLNQEQTAKVIELVWKNIHKAGQGFPWLEQHEFVCSQQGVGSVPRYVSKNPERTCNIP
jgi:hypothetical protein